jgi:hypothetical protein
MNEEIVPSDAYLRRNASFEAVIGNEYADALCGRPILFIGTTVDEV